MGINSCYEPRFRNSFKVPIIASTLLLLEKLKLFEQITVKQRVKEARSGIIRTDKHHKKNRNRDKKEEKSRKPRAAHFSSTGMFLIRSKMTSYAHFKSLGQF